MNFSNILTHITLVSSFRIRAYQRAIYLGLASKEREQPTLTNYENSQRFEFQMIDDKTDESYIRVKNTSNYVLDIAHSRHLVLLYWGKHGGKNQRFMIVHGPLNCVRIMNEDLCLSYIPSEDLLKMQKCNESEEQLFNLIEDEDEDHGIHTQLNVTKKNDLDGEHGASAEGNGIDFGEFLPEARCRSPGNCHIGEEGDLQHAQLHGGQKGNAGHSKGAKSGHGWQDNNWSLLNDYPEGAFGQGSGHTGGSSHSNTAEAAYEEAERLGFGSSFGSMGSFNGDNALGSFGNFGGFSGFGNGNFGGMGSSAGGSWSSSGGFGGFGGFSGGMSGSIGQRGANHSVAGSTHNH
ncbi:hypothetical protein EDEG_01384 [Edhazardia aedis USNM 41457]|uniref:Uncharacterized protein n=1 Tax=Edhazardia aedis (strain USNM 41457) TaxID=1003232 RepID=J9DA27_EDHAE|nr:hypothetical protein EDEG_01384 [Edhazardia aedis USNM 41457]|eukprot:EJW04369.1 hypothetical protein EDEG_01384 [Edhazardia aedis USNM 41457]